ncbi:diacylglycerol acyltransferase-domain-containing protein [Podospora appendiculata]|uniref:diacylglycerol O-acyltransferase n=1 Tax=Podospora appendiculata TaxID=314037 RepID=A0AAE1CGU6_9PEZI|nr:diacylglycerol acyltransferase-domain-containing protein [Podospora appendiculata]
MEHHEQVTASPSPASSTSKKKKGSGKKAQAKKAPPKAHRSEIPILRIVDTNAAAHDAKGTTTSTTSNSNDKANSNGDNSNSNSNSDSLAEPASPTASKTESKHKPSDDSTNSENYGTPTRTRSAASQRANTTKKEDMETRSHDTSKKATVEEDIDISSTPGVGSSKSGSISRASISMTTSFDSSTDTNQTSPLHTQDDSPFGPDTGTKQSKKDGEEEPETSAKDAKESLDKDIRNGSEDQPTRDGGKSEVGSKSKDGKSNDERGAKQSKANDEDKSDAKSETDSSSTNNTSKVKQRTPRHKHDQGHGYPPLFVNGVDGKGSDGDGNYYQAGGLRFAPWKIPGKRRLQTLAVLTHCMSIVTYVGFFFFLCAIPLTWPILIPYLLHMLLSKTHTDGRLRLRSERFRRLPIWKFFSDYFPAKLHKTYDLPPTRKYIFGYHPHGIISHGAFAAFGTEALGFSDKFPGITNTLLTLDSNFRIPLYRDYILAAGIRSVSKDSITNILTRGGPNGEGMGRAVTIVVGGARESLEAYPGTMRLVLGERKGFVKMAIRTGADLVPVLAFGENELYDQVSPKSHPKLHRLQMFALRTLKFTLPFLHGRGIFNYDVGLMPYRRPLNIVVGKPIQVMQKKDGDYENSEVDRLHSAYVGELDKMWHAYKDVFAKDRQEEMVILK